MFNQVVFCSNSVVPEGFHSGLFSIGHNEHTGLGFLVCVREVRLLCIKTFFRKINANVAQVAKLFCIYLIWDLGN